MPPKNEELFGFTGIYLNGEEITESNEIGLSYDESENETILKCETYSFKPSFTDLTGNLEELLKPIMAYDMVCTEIDGLKYTFTDGENQIVMEYNHLTDEIRKIQVGVAYRIIQNF